MKCLLKFALLCLSVVAEVNKSSKVPLVDRKLCNNDPNNKLTQQCYNSQYSDTVPCDTRVIAPENCTQIMLTKNVLSNNFLTELGRFVDDDWSIRRISINLSEKIDNFTIAGDMIDDFLIPRPMWSVVVEPFSSNDALQYVFERYNQLWDPYYEDFISRQFLEPQDCSRSRIVIGKENCVHPGYSDVRKAYYVEATKLPAVFATYVPQKPPNMDGHAPSAFISDSDCPAEHKNRWTCAFLPMTNCTLPDAAQNNEEGKMEMYTSADKDGKLMGAPRDFRDVLQESDAKFRERVQKSWHVLQSLPRFVYTSPFSHAASMFKFHGPEENQVEDFLFMEFLFRKTAFYRKEVAEMFSDFRLKYGLGDRVRTEERRFVGVHMRRDDRVIEGINTTAMCEQIILGRIEGKLLNCVYQGGRIDLCPENGDRYGCENPGEHGIGEITLDGVVKEAELLIGPSIRNMIIFTEDLDWVNKEIERIQNKDWKFYIMDPPKSTMSKHTFYDKLRNEVVKKFLVRGSGTLSGVYFHATIDLAQECDAFIGHFNSGVAMTLTGAMCNHHGGMEGVCPPVYNLRLGS